MADTGHIVEFDSGNGKISIANHLPLTVIAGPCALESRDHAIECATALKEIAHMMTLEEHEDSEQRAATRSVGTALFWIVAMNVVFSFDTVLSAVALTHNFIVMTAAIIVSGALMVLMADAVANFLKRNRMYEVLGLFVLLLVGVMLMSEGGHLGHLTFFGYEIVAMSKATFYFVLVTMVLVEIVQGRYQRKLMREKERLARHKKELMTNA